VEQLFSDSAHELLAHMEKEEKILFPYVRETSAGSSKQDSPFGSIKNPIRMMMHEHDTEGTRFKKIAALTDNFTPPADACTTYRVAFAMLKEFEEDLHMHIHLENNILFPKAIQLEDRLLSYS
jgi:regulator of cell morphogenesis and NO signaling